MGKVIAVSNQKGGVSKSTTVLNLGIRLAREGKKVLIIDNDPQGSLTASLGYGEPDDISITLASIMTAVINEEEIHPEYGILHQYRFICNGNVYSKCYQPRSNSQGIH